MPSDSLNKGDASTPEPDGCVVSAAIYARQSRVRNVAYSSCQSQIDMCRELAASRDWSITQVYSDEGHSSETLDRPQMSRLIAAIKTGDVRRLVVYSLDRLTRRMLHFQELLKLFERHSVTLAVVNDPSFSDNATGRLMANIIAAANEFQLDLTKERMADMRAAYKREGKRVAGRVPFGYRTDPATKQLVVNEEQARRVHDFFALAAGGSRPSDLAGLANLQCWPDQNGETGKWTARRIPTVRFSAGKSGFLGGEFRESLGEKKSLNPEVREPRESEILSPRVSFDGSWVMRMRLSKESSHQLGKTRFTLENTGKNTKKGR